jgi:hypothetical protein
MKRLRVIFIAWIVAFGVLTKMWKETRIEIYMIFLIYIQNSKQTCLFDFLMEETTREVLISKNQF